MVLEEPLLDSSGVFGVSAADVEFNLILAAPIRLGKPDPAPAAEHPVAVSSPPEPTAHSTR